MPNLDTDTDPTSVVDALIRRNSKYADRRHVAGLTPLPTGRTIILGCVDHRVDPAVNLSVQLGEGAVIRNISGRVAPATPRTLTLLETTAHSSGTQPGPSWNLVVIHHTDSGISRLIDYPEALAVDLARLRANPALPPGLIVSGPLYDTDTGRLETVVAPSVLDAQ